MRKANSVLDPVLEMVSVKNKTVLDVGCGTGDVARWLTKQGASVTGIDVPELVAKARERPKEGNEKYREGKAEKLPVEDNSSNIVLFTASLHHVPADKMTTALKEAVRVLKIEGSLLILEPIIDCTYYQITSLVEEETEIRKQALQAVNRADRLGLKKIDEQFIYVERKLSDFRKLLDIYFKGTKAERKKIERQAEKIAEELGQKSGYKPEDTVFQSAVWIRHLKKQNKPDNTF